MTFLTPDQADAIRGLLDATSESGAQVEPMDNVPGAVEVTIGRQHWLIGPNGGTWPAASNGAEKEPEPFNRQEALRAIRSIISQQARIQELTYRKVPLDPARRSTIHQASHATREAIRDLARTIGVEY